MIVVSYHSKKILDIFLPSFLFKDMKNQIFVQSLSIHTYLQTKHTHTHKLIMVKNRITELFPSKTTTLKSQISFMSNFF